MLVSASLLPCAQQPWPSPTFALSSDAVWTFGSTCHQISSDILPSHMTGVRKWNGGLKVYSGQEQHYTSSCKHLSTQGLQVQWSHTSVYQGFFNNQNTNQKNRRLVSGTTGQAARWAVARESHELIRGWRVCTVLEWRQSVQEQGCLLSCPFEELHGVCTLSKWTQSEQEQGVLLIQIIPWSAYSV